MLLSARAHHWRRSASVIVTVRRYTKLGMRYGDFVCPSACYTPVLRRNRLKIIERFSSPSNHNILVFCHHILGVPGLYVLIWMSVSIVRAILDYYKSLLLGTTAHNRDRLQPVQNTLVRAVL